MKKVVLLALYEEYQKNEFEKTVGMKYMFSFQGVEVSLYFDGCFDAGIT